MRMTWKNHVAHRQCLRKKNLSLEKANQVVDAKATKGILVYFYKCPWCSSYHITGKPEYRGKDLVIK